MTSMGKPPDDSEFDMDVTAVSSYAALVHPARSSVKRRRHAVSEGSLTQHCNANLLPLVDSNFECSGCNEVVEQLRSCDYAMQ